MGYMAPSIEVDRLSGLDASFLYNETASEHMHTLKLAILEPAPDGTLPPEDLRRHLGARLAVRPEFRRRLLPMPFDLHHPIWVDGGALDLDYHVRRHRIDSPGDTHAMDRLVARLAESPLDRTRPLWQAWVLEGRADGRLAILMKVHHAVADGGAATALLASIMTTDPVGRDDEPHPYHPSPLPNRLRLLWSAVAALATDLRRLPQVARDTRTRMARRRAVAATLADQADAAPPRPILDTPATSLNRAITPERAVATVSLPLRPLLEARMATGATVNDVLLTIVGGALMDLLADRGERPDRSLSAGVPVSSETGGATDRPSPNAGDTRTTDYIRTTGNKVSNLFVSLCTDIADPVERLTAIHRATTSAKLLHSALGGDLMETWLEYTPPRPYSWLMRRYSSLAVADHHRAPFNVVVSNVAGPRQPLYAEGAELVEFFSSGPVLEGIGVNVTAWSYVDRLNVMITSCARALPRPQDLAAGFEGHLDTLVEALRRAAVSADTGGYQRHARYHAQVVDRHGPLTSGPER